VKTISDAAIDALTDGYACANSPSSLAVLQQVGGAIARVANDPTAYGNRNAAYDCFPVIVAVGLHRSRGEETLGVANLDAHRLETGRDQVGVQPLGQRAGLQPDQVDLVLPRPEFLNQRAKLAVEFALRREIHDGLNVVETWNSANGFIFFGKGSEVASNRLEDREISVHALHLLQSCLVYINTLMLQRVLAEPAWMARMTPADRRGLTPLVWGHVSPYGAFDLDMARRLDLDLREAARLLTEDAFCQK